MVSVRPYQRSDLAAVVVLCQAEGWPSLDDDIGAHQRLVRALAAARRCRLKLSREPDRLSGELARWPLKVAERRPGR